MDMMLPLPRTVEDVVNRTNPMVALILNREAHVSEALITKLVHDATLSWKGRRPITVLNPDQTITSHLDLLSLLVPLAERRVLLEIPTYTRQFPQHTRESERHVGEIRFGTVARLVSHKRALSFSVLMFDRSVIKTENILGEEYETSGAFRTFMMVNGAGEWHTGWRELRFKGTDEERSFLESYGLDKNGVFRPQNWIHPNRKQSIYGAPYLILKMLSVRLQEELVHLQGEVKRLRSMGLRLPFAKRPKVIQTTVNGNTKKVKIESLECELDMPGLEGAFPSKSDTVTGLKEASDRVHALRYRLIPLVQFVIRADEAAFFTHGEKQNFIASWMKGRTWERGYTLTGKRKKWSRFVFTHDVALRYRTFTMTQTIAV
jgi:hypothetical protein